MYLHMVFKSICASVFFIARVLTTSSSIYYSAPITGIEYFCYDPGKSDDHDENGPYTENEISDRLDTSCAVRHEALLGICGDDIPTSLPTPPGWPSYKGGLVF